MRYSDAQIEHFGREFMARGLYERGIWFEDFIRVASVPGIGPEEAVATCERRRQARLADVQAMTAALKRVECGTSTIEDADLIERALSQSRTGRRMLAQRNGHYFEALRHHRNPKSNAAFKPRGGAA